MKLTNFVATTIAALSLSISAAAATPVSLASDSVEALAGIPGQDFIPELSAAGVTHLYSGNTSLTLSSAARVTFSLVGSESGFRNSLLFGGSEIITEVGNGGVADFATDVRNGQQFSTNVAAGDLASLLSFSIDTFSGLGILSFTAADHEFGVFADSANTGALTSFFLALDDNGANIDDNHDDIIIRVDLAPVPLPAAAWMLLAGLGGLAGMRRFQRAS